MTEIAKALYTFYSGFGIPAYAENSVPDEVTDEETGQNASVEPPYITYTVPQSALFDGATHQVRVWYPGGSNEAVNAKADEILAAIGQGKRIRAGRGCVCIYPGGGTLAQNQPADDTLRIVYINLQINAYV